MPVAYRSLGFVGPDSPGRALSLTARVWLCRISLDRELAEGANPTTDAARGLRALQLSSRRCRRQLAAGLRKLVEEALQPTRSPLVVTVPVNRRQVSEASELLLLLAARLEEAEEPCPRAVALASFLISDPFSPANRLFNDPDDRLGSSDRATTAECGWDSRETYARAEPSSSSSRPETADDE